MRSEPTSVQPRPACLGSTRKISAVALCLLLAVAGGTTGCGDDIAESSKRRTPGVQTFAMGDPFFVIQSVDLTADVDTFLCLTCDLDSFASLVPPAGFEKSPVLRLKADAAELRKLPSDDDFIGFVADGHRFQNDARFASPLAGGVTIPCALPGEPGFCGLLLELESDRTFVYDAGSWIDVLSDGHDRYVLYAAFDDGNLDAIPAPPGWRRSRERLARRLVVDSEGYPHIHRDAAGNLWQRTTAMIDAARSSEPETDLEAQRSVVGINGSHRYAMPRQPHRRRDLDL